MSRLWQHIRTLWPRWPLLPLLPFYAYVAFVVSRGDLRWDHLPILILVPVLAYTNARTKRLMVAVYPTGLVGLLYDAMRYIKNVGVSPERVHDCDLHALDMSLFGVTVDGRRMGLNDWFLTHHWTPVDLYCAVPYGTFLFAALAFAFILYFRDYDAVRRFAWAFFVMNVAAFITYHVYPAAPPWYFHAHGCEVSMTALPSAGPRLLNVDHVLGIHYFEGMYSRSSDLYGAVPSLHVAYPLLILREGWKSFRWPGRAFAIVFFVSMGFSAVYLDHHYVVDVILGTLYCLSASALVRFVEARITPAPAAPPAPALAIEGAGKGP